MSYYKCLYVSVKAAECHNCSMPKEAPMRTTMIIHNCAMILLTVLCTVSVALKIFSTSFVLENSCFSYGP